MKKGVRPSLRSLRTSILRPSSKNRQTKRSSRGSKATAETKADRSWYAYLIVSTQLPKTYVGVTTNFSRRLKQHNGELKGGAKASLAGRPWACACIIEGFRDRSKACEFEWKWKNFSRKLPRRNVTGSVERQEHHRALSLLQHREAALKKVEHSFDCSHLQIHWQHNLE
ncbi:hypothetical protein H6P81_002608 [Aristolochia fimbriata]|uniref:GIY-YIG domain-containing protein n=1 Tax=Aristolochia fimbriata TaxID=158543 RepID=A0AAV7FA91_ARIFI|nr:hypothetical protein H6P81_002608 [Aristolochia fimbriata]